MRTGDKNANWGGARPGAGRRRQYIKIPAKYFTECSVREPLVPDSDLTICVAEEGDMRGIVIGEIWYGADEAQAIANFVQEHQEWLEKKKGNIDMKQVLKNGAEIVRGHGIEVGLIQTEEEGKPEAWMYWLEGQGIMSQRDWKQCSRSDAIAQLNTWLGNIGLALAGDHIEEF